MLMIQAMQLETAYRCAQFCMLCVSTCVASFTLLSTMVSPLLKVCLSLYTILRSHIAVSGGILFTPPVGDSRLLSAVTDIFTIKFAFNCC